MAAARFFNAVRDTVSDFFVATYKPGERAAGHGGERTMIHLLLLSPGERVGGASSHTSLTPAAGDLSPPGRG